MVTIFDVGYWFSCHIKEKDIFKIQNLTYLAQAWHLSFYGAPFFREDFAVDCDLMTPVNTDLSHEMRKGNKRDVGIFNEKQKHILYNVLIIFSRMKMSEVFEWFEKDTAISKAILYKRNRIYKKDIKRHYMTLKDLNSRCEA